MTSSPSSQLAGLVKQGESATLEFKKSTAEKDRACRTLCAFANGQSGQLVFGVTSAGKVVGQLVTDRTLEEPVQEFQGFEPPLNPAIERIALKNGHEALVVLVSRKGTPPFTFRGLHHHWQPKAHLRNKQIATIFSELDLIEKYGSGMRGVIDTFVAYGLPEPEFEATQGGMAVTVFKNYTNKTATQQPEEVSKKMSVKISAKVFTALQADPESTIAELATQVGVTTRTIERALNKLQQENRLVRIGTDNGGYWKVLSKP